MKQIAQNMSVTGGHILGSSSSVSESSSAEKSIPGLLNNADEQLRRAREYNNRMAQKMYTHTHQTQFTHTHTMLWHLLNCWSTAVTKFCADNDIVLFY